MTSGSEPVLRTFGRTKGRPLSARQQALVRDLLPRLAVPEEGPVDPRSLAPGFRGHALEIGFGGGEHLAGQAERRPDWLHIGVEPFLNGVAKLLTLVEEAGLTNVRIHEGDARDVLPRLADGALDRVYLLFPDPWPKARHAKRRFVQDRTIAEFARVLKPGGRLRIATDVKAYADHALFIARRSPDFRWTARAADDWRRAPDDHIATRYETKGLGDCAPVFLDFIRI